MLAEVHDDLHPLIFHPASRGEDRRDLCSQSLKDYLEPAGEHQTARKDRPVTHVTLASERCCVTKMRFTRACMEGDIGVCGIAVLAKFSCGISVISILNCDIAVFSESAGWGISGVLLNDI